METPTQDNSIKNKIHKNLSIALVTLGIISVVLTIAVNYHALKRLNK